MTRIWIPSAGVTGFHVAPAWGVGSGFEARFATVAVAYEDKPADVVDHDILLVAVIAAVVDMLLAMIAAVVDMLLEVIAAVVDMLLEVIAAGIDTRSYSLGPPGHRVTGEALAPSVPPSSPGGAQRQQVAYYCWKSMVVALETAREAVVCLAR
jgi:hypothetical protein